MLTEQQKLLRKKLRQVRALIVKGWAKGWYAYDRRGSWVAADDPSACKWCLYGAAIKADCSEAFQLFAQALAERGDNRPFTQFNDAQRTRRPVLALIDRAIELAGQS